MPPHTCEFAHQTDALLVGLLEGDDATAARAHVSTCEHCAVKAVRNAGDSTVEGVVPAGLVELRMPERIGPFVVLEKLGEGGMGSVFSAYHPELDRRVAIKVLLPRFANAETKGRAQSRLLREAQSMAKLDHPNVVAVHDVGSFEQGVYLVMDRVDGAPLNQWLKAKPRSWAVIVSVMAQAARGLQAAHSAGVFHRDFKPANVLVGNDGRVRVADFGIARIVAEPESANDLQSLTPLTPATSLQTPLTEAGHLVGTLQYMAPEQFTGEAGDALSDQFSFCVSLYEALYQHRPFATSPLTAERFTSKPKAQSTLNEPSFIRAAVLRGLSVDPRQRFESMGSLIAELERRPLTLKAVAPWAVAAGVALFSAVGVYAATRPRPIEGCDASSIALEDTWGTAAKQTLHQALSDTKQAQAPLFASTVVEILNAYAGDWSQARGVACEAARGAPQDSQAHGQLRCLDFQKTQLLALIDVLTHPTPEMVSQATAAAASLVPVSRCDDARAISTLPRTPSDPALRLQVQRLRLQIANAEALSLTGQLGAARTQLLGLVEASSALEYLPLEAEAKNGLAKVYSKLNDPLTETAYRASTRAAILSGQDALAAHSLGTAAFYVTYGGRREVAQEMVEQADLLLERVGGDPLVESSIENTKALNASFDGQLEVAMRHQRRSIDLKRKVLGPKHPSTLMFLSNLAQSEADLCDVKTAAQTLSVFDSPRDAARLPNVYVRGLARLIEARAMAGDLEGAQKALELAQSLVTDDDFNAQGEMALAAIILARRLGDGESALRWADVAISAATHLGAKSVMTIASQEGLGLAQVEAGLGAQAVATLEQVLPLHQKQFGEDQLKPVYLAMAEAYLLAKRPADALTSLATVRAVFERSCATPDEKALVDWLKARALAALKREPTEARALAQSARSVFSTLPWRHRELADIDALKL